MTIKIFKVKPSSKVFEFVEINGARVQISRESDTNNVVILKWEDGKKEGSNRDQ